MANYYCVVDWNKRTGRPDSFHMCTARRLDANRLKHRMDERGRKNVRVIERSVKPRGVESVRDAMARWGLKPASRALKYRRRR